MIVEYIWYFELLEFYIRFTEYYILNFVLWLARHGC